MPTIRVPLRGTVPRERQLELNRDEEQVLLLQHASSHRTLAVPSISHWDLAGAVRVKQYMRSVCSSSSRSSGVVHAISRKYLVGADRVKQNKMRSAYQGSRGQHSYSRYSEQIRQLAIYPRSTTQSEREFCLNTPTVTPLACD